MRTTYVLAGIGIASVAAAAGVSPPFWGQWGQNPQHTGTVGVAGQTGSNILADIIYDPFTQKEEQGPYATGDLLVHYQTPLIAGNDVFMECKTGQFSNIKNWQVQTWCEQKFSWVTGKLTLQWTHVRDWKPVPFSGRPPQGRRGWPGCPRTSSGSPETSSPWSSWRCCCSCARSRNAPSTRST